MIDPDRKTLLRAGSMRMVFQSGRLQWISAGPVEAVRRIYFAFRDPTWATIPFVIDRIDVQREDRGFTLSYAATAASESGTFRFTMDLRGGSDDTLDVALRGEAQTVLETNRLGLCLHYPHEVAGLPLRSWSVDDPTERPGTFPEDVAPQQPLLGLGGIAHPLGGNTWCRASFDGDVFEMEDQRNFSDASYKVYSTPASHPIPRVLQPGDVVEQRIALALVDEPKDLAPEGRRKIFLGAATLDRAFVLSSKTQLAEVDVEVSEEVHGVVPSLGTDVTRLCYGVAEEPGAWEALRRSSVARLQALGVAHMWLEIDLRDADWWARCRRGVDLATEVDLGVDLVLADGGAVWTADILARLAGRAERWSTICLAGGLDDPAGISAKARSLRAALGRAGASVPIGSGTTGWFVDLNRAQLPLEDLDFLAYGLTPQVHAFDDDALRENLHGQEPPLSTARQIAAGRAVRVGPVTLRPPQSGGRLPEAQWPAQRDPRLDTPFGAVWTLGCIAAHAAGRAAALTLFEAYGPEAIAGGSAARPATTESADAYEDSALSIADVIREFAELQGLEVLASSSSSPLDAFCCAVRSADACIAWLANPTGRPVLVSVRNRGGAAGSSRRIRLEPYGVTRISWEGRQ